jgi:hypothetical protein
MIMEYIHTTNTVTCYYPYVSVNSRAGTGARGYALRYPGRRRSDAIMFRRFEQRLGETGSVTFTAHVNGGRRRTVLTPANEDAITTAAELTQYRTRIQSIQTKGPQTTS